MIWIDIDCGQFESQSMALATGAAHPPQNSPWDIQEVNCGVRCERWRNGAIKTLQNGVGIFEDRITHTVLLYYTKREPFETLFAKRQKVSAVF